MKNLEVKHFDEKEEEIVDALISLGLSRPIAKMLTYLRQANEVKSRELEMGTDLRQPEISIAMKDLSKRGWINEPRNKHHLIPKRVTLYQVKLVTVIFMQLVQICMHARLSDRGYSLKCIFKRF
jgi:predicted transcriptional regulator